MGTQFGLVAGLVALFASQARVTGQELTPVPGQPAATRDPLIAERYRRIDAAADGWQSEVFQDAANAQLGALGKWIGHPHDVDLAHAATFASPRYSARALFAPKGETAWSDRSTTVVRGTPSDAIYSGVDGFLRSAKELADAFDGAQDFYSKFKITGVELGAHESKTTAYALFQGRLASGVRQENSIWVCRWSTSDDGAPPLLLSVEISDCEEARGAAGGATYFRDETESVLGATAAWRDQLRYGIDHFAARIDRSLGISIIGQEGIALGDVDGDGLDDLYVCQSGGLPNRLFLHQRDGTLVDVSHEAGVDWLDSSRGALFADFDNDGDEDLVVSVGDSLVFMKNDGKGHFEVAARVPAPANVSMAAADVDGDGDLDLYVCGYMLPDSKDRVPIPYDDANNGFPNLYLRNDGNFQFVDATKESGLDRNNRRYSLACSFEDFDDDGDPDLYVANDFGRNNLYRNDHGKFVDVAAAAGVEDIGASMGVTWGDYDQDGRFDLYVSDMFSSAGERVTGQPRFMPDADALTIAKYKRHARGNALFHNEGNGIFRETSDESNTTMGRWAWGALWIDANNDGRPDIFVPNGFVTEEDPVDL